MSKFADTLYWEVWDSPFGKVTVSCSEEGVRHLSLGSLPKMPVGGNSSLGAQKEGQQGARKQEMARAEEQEMLQWIRAGSSNQEGARLARRVIAELREYASGRRMHFTVPLDLRGTPFQLKVWKALLGIPYGETRSYQQIARQIGNPRASRAVGMANHWNPVAIIVPCHRVIASDGSLAGYAGGLKRKSQLLRLEKVATGA